MSNAANKLLLAAAGNAGEAVYVDDVFSTYLYEGNGGTNTITNGVDLAGEGGLVWIKDRDAANGHRLYDSERNSINSASFAKPALQTNGTNANLNYQDGITTFNSDGFKIEDLTSSGGTQGNTNGNDHVSWTFRKQPGFFDIQTYSGSGETGQTISHNLDSVPGMVIIKSTSTSGKWFIYHRSLGSTSALRFNRNKASTDSSYLFGSTSTSTQFSIGTGSEVDASGQNYIAYFFAHDDQRFGTNSDEAIIKCGSYAGNGTSDNTINLGFEPQFLIIKAYDYNFNTDWKLSDSMRGLQVDGQDFIFQPNDSSAESNAGVAEVTSTGFRLTDSDDNYNASGVNYIYVAIRRPHKPASEFAATDLFDPVVGQTSGKPNYSSSTAVVDAVLRWTKTSDSGYPTLASRLTGSKYLKTSGTDTEATYPDSSTKLHFAMNDGWGDNIGGTSTNVVVYMFRRAPGFFDVTAHTSNGQPTQQITHNLGAAPEMAWIKIRGISGGWFVYHKDLSAGKNCFLDTNAAETTSNTTTAATFTSTYWTPGDDGYYSGGSNTQTYIAYLFATVAGISKVGSYSGTGSDVNVDCGFSAGARLVLVKRSDSTGDWYVWDAENGIVAGDDPYKLLNSGNAQVTNTDYIDPLSSGFTVTSSAPAALNTSGGTYVFYAIA
jgi:hypothetical protein